MSGVVYDAQTGGEIEVTSRNLKEVTEALRSGAAHVSDRVSVVDRAGKLYNVTTDTAEHETFLKDIIAGRNANFRLATRPEVLNIEEQKEFGDRGMAALGYGFVEGVAPGVATVGLEALGVEARTLRGLKNQNEGLFTTGQIGGIGVTAIPALKAAQGAALLLKGGTIAKGANLLGRGLAATPGGLIARAGIAAEEVARSMLPGAAGRGFLARAATEAAALGTAGTLEGALFGVGDAIRESALGNVELSTSSLAHYVGHGALFGAVGGAGLGTLFEGGRTLLSRAGARLVKNGIVSEEARDGAKILVKNGMGQELTDEAATAAARSTLVDEGREALANAAETIARGAGVPEDAVQVARKLTTDREFARMATQADEVLAQEIAPLKQELDQIELLSKTARRFGSLKMKQEVFEKFADMPLTPEAAGKSAELLDEVMSLAAHFKTRPGDFHAGPGWGKRLSKIGSKLESKIRIRHEPEYRIDAMGTKIRTHEASPDSAFTLKGAAEHAAALDEVKREIGELARSTRNPNVVEAISEIHRGLQMHLEDATMFGGMARAQKAINQNWPDYINTEKLFASKLLKKSPTRSQKGFKQSYEVDPKALSNWAKNSGTFESSLIDEIIDKRVGLTERQFNEFKQWYDIPEDLRHIVDVELPKLTAKAQQRIAKIRATVGARNSLKNLQKATQATMLGRLATAAGGAAGFMAAGPAGGLVGALAGTQIGNLAKTVLLDPKTLAQVAHSGAVFPKALLTIAGATAHTLRSVSRATRGLLRRPEGVRASPVLLAISSEELPERYERSVMAVLAASNDPDSLLDHAAAQAAGIEIEAPNVALALTRKTQESVEFLRSKVPAASVPLETKVVTTAKPEIPPASTIEMRRFLRYVHAVIEPNHVLDNLSRSGLATSEEMEALERIHGEVLNVLRENTVHEILNGKKRISRAERRRIGTVLGIELDDLNSPQIIAIVQETRTETDESGATTTTRARQATFRRSETDKAESDRRMEVE